MESTEEQLDTQSSNVRFDHEWVQVLINLRMKYAKSFTGKRDTATAAWNEILREMQELGAPESITRLKIKKKWMNLIAKYKQLKSDPDARKQSVWPYFEQIDRAYTKNRGEKRENTEGGEHSDINPLFVDANKYSEREKFMRTLIDLRFKYRHLFTGKKYASQKGWMVVQNYLPSGEKYSIDQIGKVWHNLVQRYKTLTESEPDYNRITWTYFNQLHKIMSHTDPAVTPSIEFVDEQSTDTNSATTILLSDNENPFENVSSCETADVIPFLTDSSQVTNEQGSKIQISEGTELETTSVNMNVRTSDANLSDVNRKRKSATSLDDLLEYLKKRDQRRDKQIKELLITMKEILHNLKR